MEPSKALVKAVELNMKPATAPQKRFFFCGCKNMKSDFVSSLSFWGNLFGGSYEWHYAFTLFGIKYSSFCNHICPGLNCKCQEV